MSKTISKSDLIALSLVAMLLLMCMPLLGLQIAQDRERSNRATCAANLRGIVQSMHVYSADNADMYPLVIGESATTYDVTLKPQVSGKKEDDAYKMIFNDKKCINNPYANLWILVIRGDVSPKQFLCKSDPTANVVPTVIDKEGKYFINFQDPKNVSYSTTYPWATDEKKKVIDGAPWWRATSDASVPVACDIAPFIAKVKPGLLTADDPNRLPAPEIANTSPNHQHDGQNVAFADVHAEFTRSSNIGQNKDNIWTIRKDPKDSNAPEESPIEPGKLPHPIIGDQGNWDTVMIPTRNDKGELK